MEMAIIDYFFWFTKIKVGVEHSSLMVWSVSLDLIVRSLYLYVKTCRGWIK